MALSEDRVPPNALVDHRIVSVISLKIAITGAVKPPFQTHTHTSWGHATYAWIASVPETSRFQH